MSYGNSVVPVGYGTPPAISYPGGGFRQPDSYSPLHLVRRLWARRRLLFAVAAGVFVFVVIIILNLTPRYTAQTQLVIEAPAAEPTNPLAPTAAQSADREKIASEIQVLLSRSIADKVAQNLNLAQQPEYNPTLAKNGALGRLTRVFTPAKPSPSSIAEHFIKQLKVFQVGTSRVIAVEFTANTPQLARDAANGVADLYLQQQRKAGLDLNVRAQDWLAGQIETLQKKVADSEAKVEEYRAQTGLLAGAGTELQAQQLSDLNTQLSTARAARSEADARVQTLQQAAQQGSAGTGGSADSALAVLQSPLIQQLRQQEVQLQRDITDMSTQLLPSHPRMVQKEAELAGLKQQIDTEVQKVVASVRNEARFAAARQASVESEMRRLEAGRATADQSEVHLRALERDATANRNVLESFLSRYTELAARGDISVQEANARIISPAETPDQPSFPQKGPLYALAGLIALFAGLITVFIAEITNRTIRHAGDAEHASGLPVLAALPFVRTMPQDETIRRPDGQFAEGIRSLHAALGIEPAGSNRGRIVLVTSSARGEGRTTTAVSFARYMGKGGLRVLLIDADFQRPSLGKLLGLNLGCGFSDLLAGRTVYKQVIVRDPASGVHVMPAGSGKLVAAFSSPRLQPILAVLVRYYDVVVMDGPPSSSPDAQLLARIADQCVYAVRWDSTERERLASGVRRLTTTGARGRVGLVLTGADTSAIY